MTKLKVQPLEDNILIKRDNPVERTRSGIIIATEKEQMERGEVIAVGERVDRVKKGDKILFKNYSLDIIELDGNELTFIKKENVLAVIS